MTRKDEIMDRARFEALVAAYGADFGRWPEGVRTAGEAFSARDDVADALREARGIDAMLALAQEGAEVAPELLMWRILKRAPKPQLQGFGRGALAALAACAVFGVIIGYSGGLFAPPSVEDDSYFSAAFAAPPDSALGDEG